MLPAVLLRISTGEILKHDVYPREDMGPIVGLDPDLKWLLKYTPFDEPVYDSRIFILNRIEEITVLPHPDYTHLDQYKITFTTTKRSDEEIEASILNAERDANDKLLPFSDFNKIMILSVGVIVRYAKGQTLTQPEINMMNKLLDIAVKVWKNDDELKAKILQLSNGEEPQIDMGWENIV